MEEGLEIDTLRAVVEPMGAAAAAAGVTLVTCDTKVVDKGKGDGIFITTAGIGTIKAANEIRPSAAMAGHSVILSRDIGRHGIAILSVREGLEFEAPVTTDTAPLWAAVEVLQRRESRSTVCGT